jgi:uncharacterized protein YjiS (DUF1127 family)
MNARHIDEPMPVNRALERLVSQYGTLPVLLAMIRRMVRRQNRPSRAKLSPMSDHIRRDIGLPPLDVRQDRDAWR